MVVPRAVPERSSILTEPPRVEKYTNQENAILKPDKESLPHFESNRKICIDTVDKFTTQPSEGQPESQESSQQ